MQGMGKRRVFLRFKIRKLRAKFDGNTKQLWLCVNVRVSPPQLPTFSCVKISLETSLEVVKKPVDNLLLLLKSNLPEAQFLLCVSVAFAQQQVSPYA